jgi:hypothetical protein
MSHLKPDTKTPHKMSQCRRGRHLYGRSQAIGAGIKRHVCDVCGDVTIDLTNAVAPKSPVFVTRTSFSKLKA